MKKIFCLVSAVFIIGIFPQESIVTNGGGLTNEENVSHKISNQFETKEGSDFINGDVSIDDYSGNLNVSYKTSVELPNGLSSNLTLFFNSNTSHHFFTWDGVQNGTGEDNFLNGMQVNLPLWIIGVKGFAVQTLNFEENMFTYKSGTELRSQPIWNEGERPLYGDEIPMLTKGYHFSSRIMNYSYSIYGGTLDAYHDYIYLLREDGSTITLSNVNAGIISGTDREHTKTGLYVEEGDDHNGFAKVNWRYEDSKLFPNGNFGLRDIYYYPGDGLIYHFQEEFIDFKDCNPSNWDFDYQFALIEQVRTCYLKEISSIYGDKLQLNYYSNAFDENHNYGRQYLRSVDYISADQTERTPVFEIDYSTIQNMQINNRISNQKYFLENSTNNEKLNDSRTGFNPRTNFLNLRKITNNSGQSVEFNYLSSSVYKRRLKFALQNFNCYSNGCNPNGDLKTYFKIEYPISLLNEINIGTEKNVFEYYDQTNLDNITPFNQNYFVDITQDSYLNLGVSNFVYYYRANYNPASMSEFARDNYTSTIIKSQTKKILNSNVLVNSYKYKWEGTKTPSGTSQLLDQIYQGRYYSNSQKFDDIKTEITTSNYDGSGSSFKKIKYFTNIKYMHRDRPKVLNFISNIIKPVKEEYFNNENIKNKYILYNYDFGNTTSSPRLYNYSNIPFSEGTLQLTSSTEYNLGENGQYAETKTEYDYLFRDINWSSLSQNYMIKKKVIESISTTILGQKSSNEIFTKKNTSIETYNLFLPDAASMNSPYFNLSLVGSIKNCEDKNNTTDYNSLVNFYYLPVTATLPGKLYKQEILGGIPNINNRKNVTEFFYNETGRYKGFLSSKKENSGSEELYEYPEKLGSNFSGKIKYVGGSSSLNTFTHNIYQFQPLKTTTNYNGKSLVKYTAYDRSGNLLFNIDNNGYYHHYEYDYANRLVLQIEPGNFQTTFNFSAKDRTIYNTSMNNCYTLKYDEYNNIVLGEEMGLQIGSYLENNLLIRKKGLGFLLNPIQVDQTTIELNNSFLNLKCLQPLNENENKIIYLYGILEPFDPLNKYKSYLLTNLACTFNYRSNTEIQVDVTKLLLNAKKNGAKIYGFLLQQSNVAASIGSKSYPIEVNSIYPQFTSETGRLKAKYGNVEYYYNDNCFPNVSVTKKDYFRKDGIIITSTFVDSFYYTDRPGWGHFAINNNIKEFKGYEGFDGLGNKTKVQDADGRTNFLLYDMFGRCIKISNAIQADGYKESKYIYNTSNADNNNWHSKLVKCDEEGETYTQLFDIWGNIVKEIKGNSPKHTVYEYIKNNKLAKVISPEGNIVEYQYDEFGYLSKKSSTYEGTYRYKYDSNGNLRCIFHETALPFKMLFMKYDQLNRMVKKGEVIVSSIQDFNNFNPEVENIIENENNLLVENLYDTKIFEGKFTALNEVLNQSYSIDNYYGKKVATAFRDKISDQWNFKSFSYDEQGSVKYNWLKIRDRSSLMIENYYNEQNNLTLQILPNDAYRSYYNYDTYGRLIEIKNGRNGNWTKDVEYDYYPSDMIKSFTTKNLWLRYNYHPSRPLLQSIREEISYLFSEILTHYRDGLVHTQSVYNALIDDTEPFRYNYTYWNKQISSITCATNSIYNQNYSYDYDGNITFRQDGDINYVYNYNTLKRLSSVMTGEEQISFLYDNKGNFSSKSKISEIAQSNIVVLENNYLNLPIRISIDNIVYNYMYDENGNRIVKESSQNNLKEFYMRDFSGKELAIYDFTDNNYQLKTINLYGKDNYGKVDVKWEYHEDPNSECGGGFIKIRRDTKVYYIKDHLGNIRLATNESDPSVGTLFAQDFKPYGGLVSGRSIENGSSDNRYKFTGKERDTESNLDYFGARYYDSEIGRWLSVDPLADKYPGWSPYNYCANNPMNYVDPNGLAWEPTSDKNTGKPTGYRWIPADQSYNSDGSLKNGLYSRAIFFSENGSFDNSNNKNMGSSTAYVYKFNGSIETFDACTYPSNIDKYPTVPEGRYEAQLGKHKNSYPALRNGDVGTKDFSNNKIELGKENPAFTDGRTFASGINTHKPGLANKTGMTSDKKAISAGCLLIDINKYSNFISNFEPGETISVSISRSMAAPTNQNVPKIQASFSLPFYTAPIDNTATKN